MIIDITDDNRFLIVKGASQYELDQIRISFTKELPNSFVLKKMNLGLDTHKCFLSSFGLIPSGLYLELFKVLKKYLLAYELTPKFQEYLKSFNELSKEEFYEWANDLFEDAFNEEGNPFKPYDYQIEAAWKLLRYKKSSVEISTGGGKTLISYIIFRWTIEHKENSKVLYIVPSVDLSKQTEEKYIEYESYLKPEKRIDWTSSILKGGLRKKELEQVPKSTILIGTYQSLRKYSSDFFGKYQTCICDECLVGSTKVLKADWSFCEIKNINIGDKVITYNTKTKTKEIHQVEYKYKNLSAKENLYKIKLILNKDKKENKFQFEDEIKITGNHKVYLKNGEWKRADELQIGDIIESLYEEGVIVKSIQKLSEKEEVYNLRINSENEFNHNYFANNILVSNCHHSTAKSIRNILQKCKNLEYCFGMTGTFPVEDSYDSFLIQSLIGPIVYRFSSYSLINEEKKGTPLYIIFELMAYASKEDRLELYKQRLKKLERPEDITVGLKCLNSEQKYINDNHSRMEYIAKLATKTKKNTLILFGEVGSGYGKEIYNYINEHAPSKVVYYCDGGTDSKVRDNYKAMMEKDTSGNTILVASIGTMGEGIDIKNLWNIFLVNTAKSERLVRQICGRGLRQYPGKDKVVLFDFVDDLRYYEKGGEGFRENYMWKHYKEREKIYKEQKFPIFKQKVAF